jgi:hypothetical protein
MKLLRWLSVGVILACLPMGAQTKFEFWPGANYDPASSIPINIALTRNNYGAYFQL